MSSKTIKDIRNLILRFVDDDVIALSSQLAYSLILSFFPFLIFLMTLIGYSSIRSVDVLAGLNKIIPENVLELIQRTVIEVVDNKEGNIMSFSLIFTIWSASTGLNAVIKGLNKAYEERERRSFINRKIVAIIATFGLGLAIFLMISLLVFGEGIGNFIANKIGVYGDFKLLWIIIRYTIIFSTTIFIFAALYYYAPSRKLKWNEILPGSIFATIGLMIVSIGFAFYVDNFANYSRFYGSIGAVIVLLTWLFLGSIIVIMGGELNAVLAFDREGKVKQMGRKY